MWGAETLPEQLDLPRSAAPRHIAMVVLNALLLGVLLIGGELRHGSTPALARALSRTDRMHFPTASAVSFDGGSRNTHLAVWHAVMSASFWSNRSLISAMRTACESVDE
jgi:hypothetical protein